MQQYHHSSFIIRHAARVLYHIIHPPMFPYGHIASHSPPARAASFGLYTVYCNQDSQVPKGSAVNTIYATYCSRKKMVLQRAAVEPLQVSEVSHTV